jgi:tetratricopeptide (TPR) repeat protein
MPLKERESELSSLEPELLLAILAILWNNADSTPSVACTEFEYFYRLLARQSRSIGPDGEREYLLSLFALGTGVGNRLLFRVAEAEDWLTRAEAHIALVHNDDALKARLQYQRLALSAERRRFAEVLDRAPSLAKAFERLKMPIDLLKTRLIEALALREIGLPNKGIPVMKQVFDGATFLDNLKLKAQSANGLTQLYRVVGDLDRALDWVSVTLPLLEQTKQTIGLAKLRWCFGDILREKGRPLEAMEAYTAALHDSENLGIRNDAVAIHLVLAEMLFEAYRPDEAFEHVRAALPIIDEEKMLPEAIAALSLLRESLRRRQIDKQALRELHGYFQDK